MRKLISILAITTVLGLGGLFVYEKVFWKRSDVNVLFGKKKELEKSFDTGLFIQEAEAEPKGEIVTPQTQEEARKIYEGINMIQIPRVFIDKLPADFIIHSTEDKTLFMKMITALMLRTNEKILKERRVVQILDEKLRQNIPFTEQEDAFFNKMVEKYDAVLAKTKESQMAQLMVKIDIVPVSIGVAQAILFSNWGMKNQKSLYGEFGWKDKEQYEPIEFSSLIKATDSYANALNTRSQLIGFREARKWMRPYAKERSLGWEIAHNLNNYIEEEKNYGEKLSAVYGQGLIKELDWACFNQECTFEP